MAEDLFSEFADLAALEKQKKKILDILGQVKSGVKSLSDIGIKIDGAKSVKEINTVQKEYNSYIKDTDKLKKQLLDSQKKLNEVESTYAKAIAENKLELQKKNKELKISVELEAANVNSIDKARAAVKKLTAERNALSLGTADASEKNKKLNTEINTLNDFIKKNVDLLAQQKINIGNYAGSLAKPFEILTKKLNEIKKNLEGGIGIGGSDAVALKKANDAAAIIENTLEKSTAAGVTSIKQVKNLTNAFNDLSVTIGKSSGSTETSFIQILGDSVGEAKDEVADLKDELKLKASDTQGLDNVVGIVGGLVNTAQLAASAYSLMGGSEEDAAKITAKLIALQGISNSVREIGILLTTKGTAVNKAYVFMQGLVATATNTSAAAATRFNAVLKLSAIGLIVTLTAGLAIAIYKLVTVVDEYAEKQKLLNDLRKEGNKASAEEVFNLKTVYAATQNQSLAIGERRKAVKYLQDTWPETYKQYTQEEILLGKAKEATDKLTESIIKSALATAGKTKLIELGNEQLDAFVEFSSNAEALNKQIKGLDITKTDAQIAKENNLSNESQINTFKKNSAILQKARKLDLVELAKSYSEKLNLIKEKEKTIIDFIGAQNLVDGIIKPGTGKTDKASTKKIQDNTASDILKSNYELARQALEIESDKNKAIFEDETKSFNERLDALKAFTGDQMALITIEQQFELDNEKIKFDEIIANLREQQKEKGANIAELKKQEEKETEAYDLRVKVIEGKGFSSRLKATEEFNKSLKTFYAQRQSLRDEEKQQIADYEAFTQAAIDKAVAAVAEGNKKFNELDKKKLEDKKKSASDLQNVIVRASEELQSTVLFFLTSGIDNEVALLDKKKRLLDEDTARRINQINLLGLTEQERVKKTAEVEKQAMFETEQIEKRKRKLAVERARFEKFANIASIISSTAQAVIGALGQKPWTPVNIALAAVVGGIGILQLTRAAAAPLPQYRKGTKSAQSGLALVSEEGSELLERDGKMFLTPSTPTLMELAGGEKITPAGITKDIMNSISFSRTLMANGMIGLNHNGISNIQADQMISELKQLKNETSRSKIMLNVKPGIEWEAYYLNNIKR